MPPQTLVQRLGLGYDVLSDLDRAVIRAYRLQFELPPKLRAAYREMGMALDEHNAVPCRSNHRLSDLAVAGETHWGACVPCLAVRGGDQAPQRDPDARTGPPPGDALRGAQPARLNSG